MSFKSFQVTLSVLILVVELSTVVGRYSGHDDDHEEISNEEIKERLDILINEVIQLKNDIHAVKGPGKKDKEENLKILNVRRKPLSDGNVRYTIRYQEPKIRSHTFVFWRKYQEYDSILIPESFSNRILRLPPGIRETSTITSVDKDSYIQVTIGNHKNYFALYMNNELNSEVEDTDIKIPILDITPSGDVVYEPGQNSTITIVYPLKSKDDEQGENFHSSFIIAKPGDNELRSDFDDDENENIFHPENETKYLDKSERTIKIETDNSPYSGILQFYSRIYFKHGLVKRVENHKQVILRPSTQKTVFPRGRIYERNFIIFEDKKNENGDPIIFCSYGGKCTKYCTFYGNDLKELELFKTVNGKTTREQITTYDPSYVSYERTGKFEITPALGDAFPVTYTCRVINVEGQSLNFSYVLNFGQEVKILRNETRMQRLDNGMVQVVCTANGSPLPKISIQCGDYEIVPAVLYQLDDVISVNGTCREVNSWTSWIMCTASNEFQFDSYMFDHNYQNYSSLINY